MKLDKIKFAKLIAFIQSVDSVYDMGVISTIDDMIDIELPIPIEHHYPKNDDIERLMMLMVEGTRKIEAIKYHRSITGLGLKESKDVVEKYWIDRTKSNLDVDNFGVRNAN